MLLIRKHVAMIVGGCYGHDGRVPYISPGGHDRRVSFTGGQ